MKRIAVWLGIAVAVLLLIAVALPFLIDANAFRPKLESSLTGALGREVKLGDLKLSLLSGGVSASDLSIADDPAFSKTPFLRARQVNVGVHLAALIFSRKLDVTGITIDQPEIALVESSPGVWNFSSLGRKSANQGGAATPADKAALDLSVQSVKISDGRVSVNRSGSSKPVIIEQVNIAIQDFSPASAFPFSATASIAGGGALKLNGQAGPLNSNDASITPVSADLTVSHLDLGLSRLNDFAPGVNGIVSFEGSGVSDGKAVQLSGKLHAEKLKLARNAAPAGRAVDLDFAVKHDLQARSGVLSRGDIHIGAAMASLTGTYAQRGDSMDLKMNLAGSNMPLAELQAMLPALGVVLPAGSSFQGGVANAKLAAEGPADRLITTGSVSLANAKLAGFDMGRKMSTIEKLAGIKSGPNTEIQTLSMNVRYAPEGASLDNIKVVATGIGEIAGSGTVSPSHALNFRMSAAVHALGLATVVGNTPIPFLVQGTASDPQFRPDVKGLATETLKGVVKGNAGKAAGDILKGLLGGKKQN